MSGILDFLQSPDAQLGIGLLAAGGPTTDPNQTGFGQRLAGAMNSVTANQQIALRAKLMQSQIDENASQNALRNAQLAQQAKRDAYFMGDAGYAGPSAAPAAAAGLPGSAGVQGGAPMAAPGVVAQGAPVAAGGDRFSQWSAQYGIPRDALVNDYMTNGGKGIAEMLAKAGGRDMQVSNGFVFDKNRVGPGYLPQLNMSQDGKASMVQIGPDGMPVVSAPRGAVDTYSAYQGAQANYKPIKVYNPQTQREEYTTEGAVVGNPAPMAGGRGNVQSAGYSGGDRNSANAESIRMIQSELAKPGNSPADTAAMQREIQRLQMQGSAPQSGNYAAGPSAQETATNEANRTRAVNTAAADVVRDTANKGDAKKSAQMGEAAQLASKLLGEGPTGSGIGALADAAGNFVGRPLKGATQAQQLEALSGWLTANIPRMEGPQSDADVRNYATMAGKIGDRTLPVEARKAALSTLIELQGKYSALNGGGTAPNAPSSDKPAGKPPTPMKGMVQDGYKFKGGNAADPTSWEKI